MGGIKEQILFLVGLLASSPFLLGRDLSLISLNMHGYHPTAQGERFYQFKDGSLKKARSNIFYFSKEELEKGHLLRLKFLKQDLYKMAPDIILLQEVAAGRPNEYKHCGHFYKSYDYDSPWENSARRLAKLLNSTDLKYDHYLACRGNIGWVTDRSSFKNVQIVKKRSNHNLEVVIPFNSNPYPKGVLIEGMAILVKRNISFEVIDNLELRAPFNRDNNYAFFQLLTLRIEERQRVIIIANIHAGHKVIHFEEAQAIRRQISDYIVRKNLKEKLIGVIIGGDFNNFLYRPARYATSWDSEISSVPWEIKVDGQFDFDLSENGALKVRKLQGGLLALNNHPHKPWSKISNEYEARRRIFQSIDLLKDLHYFQKSHHLQFAMKEAIDYSIQKGICKAPPSFISTCQYRRKKIDHFFISDNFKILNGFIFYKDNDYYKVNTLTDHHGIYTKLQF